MVIDGIYRAFQTASSAVPAFDGIIDHRLIILIRPGKHVSWTDLVTVTTFDAFVVDQGGHHRTSKKA